MPKAKSRVLPLLLALWLMGAVSCAKPALSEESGNTPVPPAADPVPAVTEEARETEAITEPETEPDEEASAESELTREEIASMRSEISRKRETANTDEEVEAWRAELREFDKRYAYATGTAEPETEAIPEEEYVTLTVGTYSGEIRTKEERPGNRVENLLLTAECSQTVCRPGDKLIVYAYAENLGEAFWHMNIDDLDTSVVLYSVEDPAVRLWDDREFPAPDVDEEYRTYDQIFKTGTVNKSKNIIKIPVDAPLGMYDLHIRYGSCPELVLENAIEIVP